MYIYNILRGGGGFKIGFMSPITEWLLEYEMARALYFTTYNKITESKNALVFTYMNV